MCSFIFANCERLSLFMTPIFLDIVFDMQSMWFFHVRHSFMSTPTNFLNFTLSSTVLSSKTFKSSRVLVDVIWGLAIIMKFVLEAFTEWLQFKYTVHKCIWNSKIFSKDEQLCQTLLHHVLILQCVPIYFVHEEISSFCKSLSIF